MPKFRRGHHVDSSLASTNNSTPDYTRLPAHTETSWRQRVPWRTARPWHKLECGSRNSRSQSPWIQEPEKARSRASSSVPASDGTSTLSTEWTDEKLESSFTPSKSRSRASTMNTPLRRRGKVHRSVSPLSLGQDYRQGDHEYNEKDFQQWYDQGSSSSRTCSVCDDCSCDDCVEGSCCRTSCDGSGDYWGDGWQGRCDAAYCAACDRQEERERRRNRSNLSPIAEEREPVRHCNRRLHEQPLAAGQIQEPELNSMVVLKGWRRLPWIVAMCLGRVKQDVDARGDPIEVVNVPNLFWGDRK